MKTCVKKIRCPYCQQRVSCREQPETKTKSGSVDNKYIVCSRCKKLLYVWNGVSWRDAYHPV